MTLELIKCPFCGYKYRTDVDKIVEDGEAVAVLFGLSDVKNAFSRKAPKKLDIDLTCTNADCKKVFEWEVKT